MVRVKDTRDSEISCSECLEQVSQYVNLEISGTNATEKMPELKQHLDQCLVCFEEYQLIHQLAELEAQNQPPTNGELINKLIQ